MKKFILAGCISFCLISPQLSHSQLVINELMQSNIDCIMDDLNEFPDSWVELYNAGNATENLIAYSILDKDKPKKAFQLPQKLIAPGEFVVIYCDKEETGLHASFRLESSKDACVYLYKNGEAIDKVENLKKQPSPNIAYGRASDGSDEWGYQLSPTPGKSNTSGVTSKILPDPIFSDEGRVSSTSFPLFLSLPDDAPMEAKIRYTTDGSEPTASSKEYSSSPIIVNQSTVVRAKLFCDGWISPRSLTQSFIFHPRTVTIPIISIVTDNRYFYDNSLGIYVAGKDNNNPNYKHDWRRPINFEMFVDSNTPPVLNQLCETRVKGGASRDAALKSLAVYANKRFGEKRFNYEFFPDQAPEFTDWKSIELRNAGNDFDYLYFRDAAIQRITGMNCDIDWQPWRPAVVYINGKYLGMLNIRSRSNEDYVYTFYDGLEDIDLIENNWEVKEGSDENFNAFKEFYKATDNTLEDFRKWMDIEEYANYMAMQLIFDNKDFPGNNIVCWRPIADDGKWRWIAKDTDFGLGLYGATYSYKTFNWLYDPNYDSSYAWANSYDSTRLFRRLMDIEDFRNIFIDRCAVYMGDFMRYESVCAVLDEMYASIKEEYPHHRKLINQWWPNYSEELNSAKNWIRNRISFFYNHIADYYKTGTPRNLTIDNGRVDNVALSVNGLQLRNRDFNGKYFQGQTLTVTAMPAATSWEIQVTTGNSKTSYTVDGAELKLEIPQCTSIAINSVTEDAAVEEIWSDTQSRFDANAPVKAYDMQGRHIGQFPHIYSLKENLPRGIYILRQNGHTAKISL